MPTSHDKYIPGVCNIGRTEIQRRKLIGWTAAAICLVMWALFVVFRISPLWRILLFLPAMFAAVGLLQAAWGFCAKYGLGGAFNFGPDVGHSDTVEQAEYRRQDRQTPPSRPCSG